MSDTKHIEGPWDWGLLEDGIFAVYATSPVSTVAIIRTGPNAADHARLIAAAPDLLDALRECVQWIEESPEGESATKKAFAAIAKAKGESK